MDIRNAFILPDTEYKRDLNFIEGYMNDNALYLSLMTQDPFDECRDFVKEQSRPGGMFALNNPTITLLEKDDYGDRQLKQGTLLGYIQQINREGLLVSPALTAYVPENIRVSTHAKYIEEGVKGRSIAKKEMFEAETAASDLTKTEVERAHWRDVKIFKNGEQNNKKINNNSYSGGTVSTATILHYKSTHSSLTSTCRVATSYANASNERFIRGNRHYYTPEITRSNLLSTINLCNLEHVKQACVTHGLAYPTTEQVMWMVEESTKHYWRDTMEMDQIRRLVTNMSSLQRAVVMYSGDMYHLYNINKPVIREFLEQLSSLGDPTKTPLTQEQFKAVDGDTKLLATFICFQEVRSRGLNDIARESPEEYEIIKATAANVLLTLQKYEMVFKAFFLTPNLPSSIHAFPSIRRKAVPISDTDSTMFTLMWWVEEFYGGYVFTPEARRLVFALVFLISEQVMHILAAFSKNMGVGLEKLRLLAMKNEFYFEVLLLTTRSKHYAASRDAQEGLMKLKPELEIKGVGLRDSKVPPRIQRRAKGLIEFIFNEIKAGRKLKVTNILTDIADIERSILKSLDEGRFEYLTTAQVKTADSYKSEDNATYRQYALWNEVFAPSFGETEAPPYQAVKMSLVTNNKTQLEAWYERMDNPALALRLKTYMMREGRNNLNTLIVPFAVVEATGIPKELTMAIDKRRIISNVMGAFYIILEVLGIHLLDKNDIRLVSDYY